MLVLLKSFNFTCFCFLYLSTVGALEAFIENSESKSLQSLYSSNYIRNERVEDLISDIIIGQASVNDFMVHYDSTSYEFVDKITKKANTKTEIKIKPKNVVTTVNSSHPATTVMFNYDTVKKTKGSINDFRRFTMHIISLKEPLAFDDFFLFFLKSSDIVIVICTKHHGSCEGAFVNGARINSLDPLFLEKSKFLRKVLLTIVIEVLDHRARLYEVCFYCGVAAGILIQKHEIEIPTETSFNDIDLYSPLIDIFKLNTWNFNSHIFKVGFRYNEMNFGCSKPKETVTMIDDESVVKCEALYSLEGKMLLEVQKRLKFKVELVTLRSMEVEGNPEKLISITFNNHVDWAVGGITVTALRTKMVYFSFPVSEDPAKIIYSYQGSFLHDGLSLIYVFSTFTWILIAFTLVVQTGVVYITNWNSGQRKKKLSEIIWVVGCMLTEQSLKINWKSLGGRVLILWILCCIIISTLFKAQLTSYITKPLKDPLSNLDELVSAGFSLNLISSHTRFISQMLNSSSDKFLQDLSHRVTARTEMCVIFKDLIGKKEMVIDELDVMYRELNKRCRKLLTNKDLLSLRVTRDNIFPSTHAWAFPKKSPYFNFINSQIMLYHQNGLQKKWSESLNVSPRNLSIFFNGHAMIDQSNFSTQNTKFYGHFVLWMFGIGLSLLCFVVEIAFYALQKKRNKRPRRSRTQLF